MFDPRRDNATRTARRRFEARGVLDREKARTPCADCGVKHHPCQVDVLSRDGGRRVPVARMLHLSLKRVLEEVRSSDLVCANCSRLRDHARGRRRRSGLT